MIVAHRGASGRACENSLEAFRLAVVLGADGAELDVHATRDHRLLVHHDPDLPGLGPIAALDWEHAREARLPNGEAPPLLEEALAALSGRDGFVEVKAMPPEAEAALFAAIDTAPAPARCAVHSFDHALVARLARRRPAIRFGLLVEATPANPAALLAAAGAADLWPRQDLVTPALVAATRSAGGRVIAWTANDPGEIRRLAGLGVDAICTDHPDRARAALGEVA
jgi:glycerophosphoryl diester phosphodiesterase